MFWNSVLFFLIGSLAGSIAISIVWRGRGWLRFPWEK